MIGFYEARKLDVLSILSNPHKHQFNKKNQFVLELAVEQAKIHDQIQMKYGKEFMLFIKAARHYGLMKSDGKLHNDKDKGGGKEGGLNKEAKAILNNLDMDMSIDGRSAYSRGSRKWMIHKENIIDHIHNVLKFGP